MIDRGAESGTAIVLAIATNSSMAFGGFGRHLANDFLFLAMIHPAMPCYLVCSSELIWNRLASRIQPYMAGWRSDKFIADCVLETNSPCPFTFNHTSDSRYLKMYTLVYFKKKARMTYPLYLEYLHAGYLDPNHIIGM